MIKKCLSQAALTIVAISIPLVAMPALPQEQLNGGHAAESGLPPENSPPPADNSAGSETSVGTAKNPNINNLDDHIVVNQLYLKDLQKEGRTDTVGAPNSQNENSPFKDGSPFGGGKFRRAEQIPALNNNGLGASTRTVIGGPSGAAGLQEPAAGLAGGAEHRAPSLPGNLNFSGQRVQPANLGSLRIPAVIPGGRIPLAPAGIGSGGRIPAGLQSNFGSARVPIKINSPVAGAAGAGRAGAAPSAVAPAALPGRISTPGTAPFLNSSNATSPRIQK